MPFQPTHEQQHALDLFATGNSLAIEAGAGTGKTSTLKLLAEASDRQGQYIAFNKAIVVEAGEKFPATVNCSTAHSLAFRAVGRQYSARLGNSRRMRSLDIAARLGVDPIQLPDKQLGPAFLAGLTMRAVTRFCQSADMEPGPEHVPYIEGIDPLRADGTRTYGNNREVAKWIGDYVKKAWRDLMSPDGQLPYKHDHYLKAWHLSGPRIGADFILFDEAQDANPVMVAIVAAQQHAQLIWVGDSQQQIYGFTGAINALANVPAEQRAFLTQSFRFGPAIADEANRLLEMLDADLRLTGTETIASSVGDVDRPDVILTRTNAAAVTSVLYAKRNGTRCHLVGGGKEVVSFAKAAQILQQGGRTEHPELACFESWGEVQEYVSQDEQGGELRLLVKLVDDFGAPTIIDTLERLPREENADLVVSTAHKSKGREWRQVKLSADYSPTPNEDELRLLYVACTRAQDRLDHGAVAILNMQDPMPEGDTEIAASPQDTEPPAWATPAATTATDSPDEPDPGETGVEAFADDSGPQNGEPITSGARAAVDALLGTPAPITNAVTLSRHEAKMLADYVATRDDETFLLVRSAGDGNVYIDEPGGSLYRLSPLKASA